MTGSDSRRCHLLGWQSSTWFPLYCATTVTADVFLVQCRPGHGFNPLLQDRSKRRCMMHLQIDTLKVTKQADFELCKRKVASFCVSCSVGAKWELKSWTDCVYTLSSALGDACRGANALCWLCVWHSYITNISHWGPQSRDRLSFCLPENGTKMGRERVPKNHLRAFALSLFLCPMAVSEIERECEEEERRQREERGGGGGGWWVCLSFHALGKQI